ncbi:Fc receptor-like protein 5 isoform X2 [Heptranchias perlo]|uniref:Fc receptor-like protein 5 isoform X2 n=1 Tax=Heptranchias perlo TaxID=212740 RepID=UPI00355AAB6C
MRIYYLLFLFVLAQYAACQEHSDQLSNPTIQGPERVQLNDLITISCMSSGGMHSITYSLYREKTLVQALNVSASNPANFSVSFHSESEAGVYKCKAENDDSTQAKYSDSIKIIVLAPVLGVMVNSTPDPPVLEVQSKLTLSCFVKQGSNVTYQWYFNNQKISLLSPSVKINQSKLVINDVSLNDTGGYQCEASNQFDMKTFRITSNSTEVTVKVPVSNPEISAKIAYTDGNRVMTTISCLSHEGTLPIIYTLYRNMSLVENYTAQSRRAAEIIVVLNYTQLQDTLKCKAENGFVSKYSNGLVIDLSVKLTSNPDPPILGQQLTLICNVTYKTERPYTWHFVQPGKNSTVNTEQNQFIAVDPGMYYCSVNGQISNRIEVPGQGSGFQPVTTVISVAATLLLILAVGLICYCTANKDFYD